ncbi:MAG: cytochrome c biogenesis protein CcdA [bacterium]|nr:cytochrome c biogenesis protein CcdA [bacterium]
MSRVLPLVLLVLLATAILVPATAAPAAPEAGTAPAVAIYFNGSCHDCVPYLNHELVPLLQSLGAGEIVRRDYILERRYRKELVERSEALGIPPQLQGHMTIFIGDRIVLQGHVPSGIIRDLFSQEMAGKYARIVVLQDKMAGHGEAPKDYTAWAPGGQIKIYRLDEPIRTYLATLAPAGAGGLPAPTVQTPPAARSGIGFALMVLGAGLLDGINPCAFAVLLLFVAFLFTLQRGRADLLAFGFTYVGAIYLTYFGIGIGLLTVFQLGAPHLMAKLGAGLMIVLGLVNIKDFFWYGIGPSLTLPKIGGAARDRWMRRATLPATAVVGFLVGICEFPCTGGIYVGILGLLSTQTSFWNGLAYLAIYNVMFVLPLVALLLVIGNRRVVGQFSRWMATNKKQLRLGQGLVMIAIGAIILLWFV